jgi:serine phosphatase RsbU (regulator of sigma subunit)
VSGAVLVIGLAVTVVLSLVTLRDFHRNEQRLLALQTRLTADAISGTEPLYVEDHLGGAASLAAATNGRTAAFGNAMRDSVTAGGSFASASLWQLTADTPRLIASVGGQPLLAPVSARAAAIIRQAAASKSFVVAEVTGPHALRLGYAISASGAYGTFVAYGEEPLPASRRVTEPADSPIAQLNLAVYLGPSQTSAALLESDSVAPLPLRGTTFTSTVPFGSTVLTITTSPRSSLSGAVSASLPWAIAAGGLVLTLLAVLLTERLTRRRESAERLTEQVEQLYVEQRPLMPAQMPVIPGVQIAVRYLPGTAGVDIGGDWYDVVPLSDRRFVFVIGDVSGRGVRAAAVMASLHFASRAYAFEGHPPAVILAQLRQLLDLARDGNFATVLCGLVDVGAHEVILASAGHPPPLVGGGGHASFADVEPGPPIGIAVPALSRPATVKIPVAGMLIAYTDGLIERRNEGLDTGMNRLAAAAVRDSSSFEELLDGVVAELTGDSPNDDIALIGLRWLN